MGIAQELIRVLSDEAKACPEIYYYVVIFTGADARIILEDGEEKKILCFSIIGPFENAHYSIKIANLLDKYGTASYNLQVMEGDLSDLEKKFDISPDLEHFEQTLIEGHGKKESK